MEKTIDIGGKPVKLKATAKLALIYRDTFGEEILAVQGGLIAAIQENDKSPMRAIQAWDSVGIIKLIWTMAKNADKSVPPMEDWLDTFDTFPITSVVEQAAPLILANVATTTRIKNAGAAESR